MAEMLGRHALNNLHEKEVCNFHEFYTMAATVLVGLSFAACELKKKF